MRPTDSSGDNSVAQLEQRLSLSSEEKIHFHTWFDENSDIQQKAVRNVNYTGKTRSVFEFLLEEAIVCSFVNVLYFGLLYLFV